MGVDRGADYIGGDLIKFFNSIQDENFIFSVDDFFLIRDVNIKLLNFIEKEINNVGRFSLTDQVSNKPHTIIKEHNEFNVIEMSQHAEYRKSAVWSMWSKDYFLKYFKDNMNLWQWELDTSCQGDNHSIIGTTGKHVVQACHLYKQGSLKSDWYKDSESSDVMYEEDKWIVASILHL